MATKFYAKQTVEEVLSKTKVISNDCWIYPFCKTTTFRVSYNGEPTYLIKALFGYFNKPYYGKIIRSCGISRCINPNHLHSPTKEEKFWSNVIIKGEDDCWEWKSVAGTGEYSVTSFEGKEEAVHRISWKLYNKQSIPEEMYICHHCDNPPCCNPKHLFLGTRQDNVDDRERKGRNKMPHSLGEDHGNHKLNRDQVREIRKLYTLEGMTYRKIGDMYGVTFGHIRNIIKGRDWGWLE